MGLSKLSLQDWVLICVLIAAILLGNNILTPNGLEMMLRHIADLSLYTAAQTFVLLLGAIDLSQQAMVNLTNYYFILLANEIGFYLALIIILAAVGLIYFTIGYLIKKTKSDPFIFTLGLMFVYNGIAENLLSVTNSNSGKTIPANTEVISILNGIFNQNYIGIPFGIISLIIITILISYYVLNRLNLGLFMIAIGSNEKSADRIGINIPKVFGVVFSISALFSCIGSIFDTSRTFQGSALLSNDLLFQSIGASVLGGVALSGGIGNVWTFMRGVLIFVLSERALGLTILGSDIRRIVLGIIIILVVVISNFNNKTEEK